MYTSDYMSKTAIVTARLDPETLESLDALATARERTRAWLVEKAVKRFVEEENEFDAFLKEGEDAIDRGDYLTHDEMMAEIRAWQRDRKTAA
jgi:predicted transcriptional regulator